jgi:hypothetical protein
MFAVYKGFVGIENLNPYSRLYLKGHCHVKSVSEKQRGDALGLQYELQLYLKTFRLIVLKLRFFKPMFDRSKNALICGP